MPFTKKPAQYSIWQGMLDRCRNPRNASWHNYGGRGIGYCERWESYAAWAKDMLPRIPGYSLERIDNAKGYSPCNCYWADKRTQQRNRREALFVEIEGRRYRAIELADQVGVKTDTIVARAKRGMTLEQVMFKGRHVDASSQPAAIAAWRAMAKTKTHCSKGHAFTEANTYVTKEGWRCCRACHNAKMRRLWRARSGARSRSRHG